MHRRDNKLVAEINEKGKWRDLINKDNGDIIIDVDAFEDIDGNVSLSLKRYSEQEVINMILDDKVPILRCNGLYYHLVNLRKTGLSRKAYRADFVNTLFATSIGVVWSNIEISSQGGITETHSQINNA